MQGRRAQGTADFPSVYRQEVPTAYRTPLSPLPVNTLNIRWQQTVFCILRREAGSVLAGLSLAVVVPAELAYGWAVKRKQCHQAVVTWNDFAIAIVMESHSKTKDWINFWTFSSTKNWSHWLSM